MTMRQDFPDNEMQPENEYQPTGYNEPEPEPAGKLGEETQESDVAKVDIVTSDKKVTVSAPVKEFEEFKNSFKSMMVAFSNFIEATGLEIGKDETTTKINTLMAEFGQLRDNVRDEMVPRSEFDDYKTATEEKEAQASADYVRRDEFERFRRAIKDAI